MHIFQCMGKIFCVEFQRVPLKFHTKYLTHILIDNFWLRPSSSMNGSFWPSVCLSVYPSVTPFWLCSHHRIIMKCSGVIIKDQGRVHTKGQGQRSKVKVTEVTTQHNRFRTVIPLSIHIWRWNDAYSLMLLRRGALLFFEVNRKISRSHGFKNRRISTQIRRFRTVTPVWIHQWL